ncbi:MAG: hypothetical protein ABI831_04280 [Betaproteobacteria bacterium]
MGCSYEFNDTLLLTKDQGFPSDLLNIKRHQKKPVTLKDVEGKTFSFKDKPAARAFQLDPVRVYLFELTANDKWLGWGRAFIQSLTIERKAGLPPSDPAGPISFNAGDWVTSGTFRIIDIYDPKYQKIFTLHEAPAIWNYFGKG